MRIDSHHHFWNYSADEYGWINENMTILQRDYLPADLQSELATTDIDGVISVQARQSVVETEWLTSMAQQHDFIRGVVGWVPLADPQVGEILAKLSRAPELKAVRHVVHDEPDDQFLLGAEFNRGISQLRNFNLVYDILIFAKHLKTTIDFVDHHPGQSFVLDHIAKPTIQAKQFDEQWKVSFCELAKRDNVVCKFSGVVTEVRDAQWDVATVQPYWDVALEAYGPQRLMFGSDWPVCLLKSGYSRWWSAVKELSSQLSQDEQAAFWGGTAQRAYRL